MRSEAVGRAGAFGRAERHRGRNSCSSSVLILAVLAFAWIYANRCLGARQHIQASGELTYLVRPNDPARSLTRHFTFEVTTDGRNARLKTIPDSKNDVYEQVLINGNRYVLDQYAANPQRHSGQVDYRAFPIDDSSNISYLWLAYASAGYFATRSTNRLEPIWILDDPNLLRQGFTQEAMWETNNFGLPTHVVYLNDGWWRGLTGQESTVEKYAPPYDRGFTNAEFKVLQTTKLNGFEAPLEFSFTRYGVVPRGNGKYELDVLTFTRATVLRVALAESAVYSPPEFVGVADIVDRRFAKSNPPVPMLVYQITNGLWHGIATSRPSIPGAGIDSLRTTNTAALAEYQKAVWAEEAGKRAEAKNRHTTSRRTIVFGAMLLVVTLGAFWVYRFGTRKKSAHN